MLMELKISVDQEILEYVNLLNCCVFSLSYMQVAPSMVVTRRRLQSYLVPSFSSIVATGVCVCVLKSIMVSVEGYHVSLSWVRSMLSAHFGVPHPLVLWWWCICCVSLVASRLVWCVIVACCICEFASDSVVVCSLSLRFSWRRLCGSL
uniref:Uncharacterized protein n=1 Tax=Brassica oleracea TaxID=3712 RepID=A0A3P6GSU8_BRAOL|nr:unnamed protein product [Brassica oleracea]